MMQERVLILLYGLSCWGALLNFPAWGRLFLKRLGEERPPALHDPRLLTRGGLTLLSFGIVGLAGSRLFAAILGTTPITVPSLFGLFSIGCMAAAEPAFLFVDEIHARETEGRSIAWRLYWAGVVGGLIYCSVRWAT